MIETAIEKFTNEYRLTPRESEIFSLLVNRIVTLKKIAEHIGSSPHTVKNQLKSILDKTRTRSKCELLGLFATRSIPAEFRVESSGNS